MGQAEIIKVLQKYKKGLTAKEISERCEAGRTTTTNALRRMWRNNEVEREKVKVNTSWELKYWIKNAIQHKQAMGNAGRLAKGIH